MFIPCITFRVIKESTISLSDSSNVTLPIEMLKIICEVEKEKIELFLIN